MPEDDDDEEDTVRVPLQQAVGVPVAVDETVRDWAVVDVTLGDELSDEAAVCESRALAVRMLPVAEPENDADADEERLPLALLLLCKDADELPESDVDWLISDDEEIVATGDPENEDVVEDELLTVADDDELFDSRVEVVADNDVFGEDVAESEIVDVGLEVLERLGVRDDDDETEFDELLHGMELFVAVGDVDREPFGVVDISGENVPDRLDEPEADMVPDEVPLTTGLLLLDACADVLHEFG